MFTTLYFVKVLYLTFLTNPNRPLVNYKQVYKGNIFISFPLIILAIFSIFFNYITKDIFIGLGLGFFSNNALFIYPLYNIILDTERTAWQTRQRNTPYYHKAKWGQERTAQHY